MLISRRSTNMLLLLVLAVGVAIVAMLASDVRGGPLDPPGTPASTMHTLDDSPVVWDRVLTANDGADSCHSSRFRCVLPTAAAPTGDAVLDRETGLVWQRTPPTGIENWDAANVDCMNVKLGDRYGWRLARMEEYRSVLDSAGLLPAGHPFTNVRTADNYWSASTLPSDSTLAYLAKFEIPVVRVFADKSAAMAHPWCVRSGAGLEGV